ncbi:unnamed protein product [Ceutorhynchus assimilis]|uniref:inositol-3-phosphate synthase n=1 Tax=Ceutorhynchus assimilis TaxID=467358 RepID=A0A9N9N328_9CUCU|nr:unnamed protein product [Ceutorhynchus assimilis]
MDLVVISPNVKYTDKYIEAQYNYQYTKSEQNGKNIMATNINEKLNFRTERKVPKLGVMLVGWGGNNGSTLTAALIANRLGLSWPTKTGQQRANWFGSITQASTVRVGDDICIPLGHLLPTINPNDLVVDGWDISSKNLADAMVRSQVLEPALQEQLKPHLVTMKPRPAIFNKDFIADNQSSRVDNIITGSKLEQVQKLMEDIDDFKATAKVDKIIVLWTANTERLCNISQGVNDTSKNLLKSIKDNHPEISPSTLFAYAAISKGCTYINGSPQNTFVPGLIEYAEERKVFIAGDDFKSGQTKLKSVLVDFLVSAGIKPVSIVSYNHLGNNDGKNLSAPAQFRSKEISKSDVVDDVVQSNRILYQPGEKPDHVVVIKYVPYVGDSKRAMDEYTSEIMMGGHNTLVIHNTCEDSLLAAPLILDLVILAELFSRIQVKKEFSQEYTHLHPVLSVLGYLCKAPLVPKGTPVVNALFRQRSCLENILRACAGLPVETNMGLEHKIPQMVEEPLPKKAKISNGQ